MSLLRLVFLLAMMAISAAGCADGGAVDRAALMMTDVDSPPQVGDMTLVAQTHGDYSAFFAGYPMGTQVSLQTPGLYIDPALAPLYISVETMYSSAHLDVMPDDGAPAITVTVVRNPAIDAVVVGEIEIPLLTSGSAVLSHGISASGETLLLRHVGAVWDVAPPDAQYPVQEGNYYSFRWSANTPAAQAGSPSVSVYGRAP